MPLAVRCDRCGKSQSVPDSLVGAPIICSYCGQQVIVKADAPLMPPPLPGSAPAVPTRTTAAPAAAATATHAAMPAGAPPSRRSIANTPLPAGPRPTAPPAGPPMGPPPAPAVPPAVPRRGEVESGSLLEDYQRSLERQRTRLWPWILVAVLVVAIIIVVVAMRLKHEINPNPDPASITTTLSTNPKAVAMLGPRQEGLGYSLQLPSDFAPVAAPSTAGLLEGTQSFAWAAKTGTEGDGSVCRLWVIPKVLHLEMELQQLNDLGSLVDFPVAVQNKSGYGRLGADMICVRALLENPGATRKGVIYLILDGRQTLMIVGLAAGSNVSNLQTLLDNSVRTIQRASAPEKK